MEKNTCCFLGHRRIIISNEIENKVYNLVKQLIVEDNIYTFLFGSKSEFNDLCYQIISKLKAEYSHIKRIYVRAEYHILIASINLICLNDMKIHIIQIA